MRHGKCSPNRLKLLGVPKHVCESLPQKYAFELICFFWLSDTRFYLLELKELFGVCSMGSVYSLTSRSNSIHVWSTTTFSQFLDIFSIFLTSLGGIYFKLKNYAIKLSEKKPSLRGIKCKLKNYAVEFSEKKPSLRGIECKLKNYTMKLSEKKPNLRGIECKLKIMS